MPVPRMFCLVARLRKRYLHKILMLEITDCCANVSSQTPEFCWCTCSRYPPAGLPKTIAKDSVKSPSICDLPDLQHSISCCHYETEDSRCDFYGQACSSREPGAGTSQCGNGSSHDSDSTSPTVIPSLPVGAIFSA